MDGPAPIVGELLKMSDRVTGFSPDNPKENRPYVVIRVTGRRVRVVPQSSEGDRGVYIPDGTAGLEEGWFVPWEHDGLSPVRRLAAGDRPAPAGSVPRRRRGPVADRRRA